jgi:hypothetical protein
MDKPKLRFCESVNAGSEVGWKIQNLRFIDNPTYEYIDKLSIDQYLGRVVDESRVIHNEYDYLNELFSGDIPDDIIYDFKHNPYEDYLLEMLNSVNTQFICSRMIKEFPGFGGCVLQKLDKDKSSFIIKHYYKNQDDRKIQLIKAIINSDEFRKFNEKYCYEFSQTGYSEDEDGKYFYVLVEPVYAQSANDYIDEKCYGHLYHVTDSVNAKYIIENGFKPKNTYVVGDRNKLIDPSSKEMKYRNFKERIYFYAIPPKGKNIFQNDELVECSRNFFRNHENFAIFEVRVRLLNIPFYFDSVLQLQDRNNAVYTYHSIPPAFVDLRFKGSKEDFERKVLEQKRK